MIAIVGKFVGLGHKVTGEESPAELRRRRLAGQLKGPGPLTDDPAQWLGQGGKVPHGRHSQEQTLKQFPQFNASEEG